MTTVLQIRVADGGHVPESNPGHKLVPHTYHSMTTPQVCLTASCEFGTGRAVSLLSIDNAILSMTVPDKYTYNIVHSL